ncbi:conserved hypothetical protein [Paraburkholderia piptadeniae]|uniref:N-acetyltransferase domain-containing protein n=1 Tax=Paraburkholderia piptadeniae TaxID=1701573 RepID=A0A1N7RYA1_9BURK|nr:GNAT family N-acetyltransferase [Paraburkholderia piptadeniae]SIT40034.1 conserved hypothetical protein [Paraburkholderia piptadeniae]
MSTQMADPHQGMLSFEAGLRSGILEIGPVPGCANLYSHFDRPAPGVNRLTYARLQRDLRTVEAFVSCIMNGEVDGFPCVALGYAVPEAFRRLGYAKQILREVIRDQVRQAGENRISQIYVEAVIDVTNLSSQRVAEAVLNAPRESITDAHSGRDAYRYTARFETATGRQL